MEEEAEEEEEEEEEMEGGTFKKKIPLPLGNLFSWAGFHSCKFGSLAASREAPEKLIDFPPPHTPCYFLQTFKKKSFVVPTI